MKTPSENQIPLPSLIKTIEEKKTFRIVRMKGPVNLTNGNELDQFVRKFRNQKRFEYKYLLLDFADVTQIHSSAIAAVVKAMLDYKKTITSWVLLILTPNLEIKSCWKSLKSIS